MDLNYHGDTEVGPGLIDLAVNVRHAPLPDWLAEPIVASLSTLDLYPDSTLANEAVAARHRRPVAEVLLTAGAAQAFVLIAQALKPRRAVVVHPQFTEPEAALLAAGHAVERVLLPPPFTLDASLVPPDADLVILGNPTNPTSIAHRLDVVASLARTGRILVIDEAFADLRPESLAERRDLPGLVVVRSLTKTWALAGLRVGYLLAEPELINRFAAVQPLWPVSTPALAAAIACSSPVALATERDIAAQVQKDRDFLVCGLAAIPSVQIHGTPASSFVLISVPNGLEVRESLRENGFAVRRCDTFPGLGPDWLRIAVRDPSTSDAFLVALKQALFP